MQPIIIYTTNPKALLRDEHIDILKVRYMEPTKVCIYNPKVLLMDVLPILFLGMTKTMMVLKITSTNVRM